MLPNKWRHPVFKKRGITSAKSKNTCFVIFITRGGNFFDFLLLAAGTEFIFKLFSMEHGKPANEICRYRKLS